MKVGYIRVSTAEQAYALEVAGYVGGADGGGYTFVPVIAQSGIEGFDAAAELDGDSLE